MPPKEPFLVVGTPAFGGLLTSLYTSSMLKLQLALKRNGIPLQVVLQNGDSLIPRARQDILTQFLEQREATHLLFIDADIGFEPDQVFRLMQFNEDCTAAVYPHKWMNPAKLKALAAQGKDFSDAAALSYVYEPQSGAKAKSRKGFITVRYAGTGFLMLRRSMVTAMMEKYKELRFSGNFVAGDQLAGSKNRCALFNCMIDPETNEYLSEDYSFCRRWLDMGGEIWADTQSRLTHTGASAVRGDFSTQFPDAKS